MFINLSSNSNDDSYCINKNHIILFQSENDYTVVYTTRQVRGISVEYHVKETPSEILGLLNGKTNHDKYTSKAGKSVEPRRVT